MAKNEEKDRILPAERAALGQVDAAAYVGVCPGTLRNYLNAGRLSDIKVGRRRLYRVDELNALVGAGAAL